MIRSHLIFGSLVGLVGCGFGNATWTEGSWQVSSIEAADGQDECGIVPVLSSLDAISYTFGPEVRGDSALNVSDQYYDDTGVAEDRLLEGDALTSAQANLWNLCDSPDPYFDCDVAIEQIHAEKWLTAVKASLAESQCSAGEWKASSSWSEGILLSKNEALVNSRIRLTCDVGTNIDCESRFTSRIRSGN